MGFCRTWSKFGISQCGRTVPHSVQESQKWVKIRLASPKWVIIDFKSELRADTGGRPTGVGRTFPFLFLVSPSHRFNTMLMHTLLL